MARAKRTDRSEARRQYRAYLAAQAEAEATAQAEEADAPDEDRSAGARPARAESVPTRPAPGQRVGIVAAARGSFRTPHYLDDLKNIGPLVFRTNALWPVAAICLIAALVSYARINGQTDTTNDPILSVTFQFILYPLPLLPPMIAGYFAPRSTWLAGLLAAAISTLTLVVLLVATSLKIEGGTGSIQSVGVLGTTVSWLSAALPFGALIGAGSGWYKRFLEATSGGRSRGGSRPSSSKKPVRRSQPAKR